MKETRRAVQALRAGVLEEAGSFPAAPTALVQKAADGMGLEVEGEPPSELEFVGVQRVSIAA